MRKTRCDGTSIVILGVSTGEIGKTCGDWKSTTEKLVDYRIDGRHRHMMTYMNISTSSLRGLIA